VWQLSRSVFEMAVNWAMQSRDGLFWASAQGQRTFVFGSVSDSVPKISARDAQARIPKNREDEIWLGKLRNMGMPPDDEWKIVALREYIWRMAQSKPRLLSDSSTSSIAATISLQNLDITPYTIFFDENESLFKLLAPLSDNPSRPLTIADALMDASKTIDRPPSKSASKLHLKRMAEDIRRQRNVEWSGSLSGSGSTIPTVTAVDATTATKPLQIPAVRIRGTDSAPVTPSSVENGSVLRHKGSKNSLLNRGMGPSKAPAETSTVSATAVGRVGAPLSKDTSAENTITTSMEPQFPFRAAHSYDGNDPHILHLLDTMYLQNYPSDIVEFGPTITPAQRQQPIKKSNVRLASGMWKPEGTFVASFGDHTEPINRVVVAPDHNFFVTASDDGTVKIWDTTRLEKNVGFRARQSYKHGNNIKVKALCFVENTRCFVSGATDGSVHVVKVEFSTTAAKYGKLRVMREFQLPESQEYAVWMEHFKADSGSILLIATNASNLYALDLRTMQILYTLKNPVYHGTPTCFCIDKKRNWLVVGTSHGILDLWDIRYQLRLKAWGLPGSTPIHRLQSYPLKGRNRWILVAGGTGPGELSVWDCDKVVCKEVYRAGSPSSKDWLKPYAAWNVDDESPETILQRFATSLTHLETPTSSTPPDRGVRAFAVEPDFEASAEPRSVTPGFIIATGGNDRKIRYWNTARIESSTIVSGLEVDEAKPSYVTTHPSQGLTIFSEKVSHGDTESVSSTGSGGIRGFLGVGGSSSAATTTNSSGRKKGSSSSSNSGRSSRSTVISQQQQQLLRSHLDTVTDVAFLEVPYGMIVSVDKGGMVFVYQ